MQYAALQAKAAADEFVMGYAEGKREVLEQYAREQQQQQQQKGPGGETVPVGFSATDRATRADISLQQPVPPR